MFHNLPRKALLIFIILTFSLIGIFLILSEWRGSNHEVTVEPRFEEGSMEEPKTTYETIEEPEDIQEITLPFDTGTVTFHMEDVPLLHGYLKVSEDPEAELQRMRLLSLEQEESIYLLEYGPDIMRKSYILLHILQDEIFSILVADLTKFKEAYFSPERTKVALVFFQNKDSVVTTDKFKIIDLEKWEELILYSGDSKLKVDGTYPITAVTWLNEDELSIMIPDIMDPSDEDLIKWYNQDLPLPTMEIPVTFKPQKMEIENENENEEIGKEDESIENSLLQN
ncbi:hypothetical protein RZN25_09050 [Bacillaceae bacterium S4-13-56]